MKKFAIFLILLFCIAGFSKTLIIKGNYIGFSGKKFKKVWKVNIKKNKVEFFLDGKHKATMYIEKGKVIKIEETKRFAGKDRLFVITKPQYIELEMKTQFFPFTFVYNYLQGHSINSKNNRNNFQILEVRKNEKSINNL